MMIVYVTDTRSYDVWPASTAFGRHSSQADVVFVAVPPAASIPDIVSQIMARVSYEGMISLLMIRAHGNAGSVQLGTGLNATTAAQFRPLAAYMSPGNDGCEIHACAVASATPVAPNAPRTACTPGTEGFGVGITLLSHLAAALNCQVRAATNCQTHDTDGLFEGGSVVVNPDGSVASEFQGRPAPLVP